MRQVGECYCSVSLFVLVDEKQESGMKCIHCHPMLVYSKHCSTYFFLFYFFIFTCFSYVTNMNAYKV